MILGDLEEAQKSAERSLYIAPQDRDSIIFKGNVEFARKNFASAVESFKKVLVMSDREAVDWYNLAVSHLYNRELEEADKSLAKALEINEELFEAHMGRALYLHLIRKKGGDTQKLREEAQQCLKEARRLDSEKFKASVRQDGAAGPTLNLNPVMNIPISFELSFESLFVVFEPINIFHLLYLDDAF
jgi:tetratricopeptide (TPR) repeat protein